MQSNNNTTIKINWLNKYKPQKLSDVIGNKECISKLNLFLKPFKEKIVLPEKIPNPNIIITGTNGVSKTLITDLAIKENGFEKMTVELSKLKSKRKKKNNIKNTLKTNKLLDKDKNTNRTVESFYRQFTKTKKLSIYGEFVKPMYVLVFDDVSSISNPKEKDALKTLVKINNKEKLERKNKKN